MNTNNFSWINFSKTNWFIKYFLYFCKKVDVPKDLYNQIESLKDFEKSWLNSWINIWSNFFSVFLLILEDNNKNLNLYNTKLDLLKNNEISLFLLWLNLIKWYLNYLNEILNSIKKQPMEIGTFESILDLEEEINKIILKLDEQSIKTNWTWLKNHIDSLHLRLTKLSLEVNQYNERKNSIVLKTRQKAWSALINSWKVKNQDIYSLQNKLNLPLSLTTNDIVSWVKSKFNNFPWIESLDLKDPKILTAIKAVQEREKDNASDFSICLRNDLHKKFWSAANDRYFYNSFLNVYSEKAKNDVTSLNITWYDTFNIISYEPINWSDNAKFKIQCKLLWSDRLSETEIYCDPSKLVSWQQARVWILQPNRTIKIELLNINKIYNSWTLIKKEEKVVEQKQWFFGKAKNFISNKISNFLNRKAA